MPMSEAEREGVLARYTALIAATLTEHDELTARARSLLLRLRAEPLDPDVEAAALDTFGLDGYPRLRTALDEGDQDLLSRTFYGPLLASLVHAHREALERALLEETGATTPTPGEELDRLDGRCMVVLREHVDAGTWAAFFAWAWRRYGPSSPQLVEVRRATGHDRAAAATAP